MKKLMKKTSLLLLVCMAAFAFTGCTNDDDSGVDDTLVPGVDDTLVGTWEIVSFYSEEYVNDTLVSSSTDDSVGITYVFGQDGSVSWNGRDIGTWAVAGSTFYLTATINGETYTYTYTLKRESDSRIIFEDEWTETYAGGTYRYVEATTMERVGGSSGSDTDDEEYVVDEQALLTVPFKRLVNHSR